MKITAVKTLPAVLHYAFNFITCQRAGRQPWEGRRCGRGRGSRRVEGWGGKERGAHAASVAHKIEQNTCKVTERDRYMYTKRKRKREKGRSLYSMAPPLTPLQLSGMPACGRGRGKQKQGNIGQGIRMLFRGRTSR